MLDKAFLKLKLGSQGELCQYSHLLKTVLHQLTEIMRVFQQQKKQQQLHSQQTVSQLHKQYTAKLTQKQQLIKHLQTNLDFALKQIQRLEHQLQQEIEEKEQTVKVLKSILKKRIIEEVKKDNGRGECKSYSNNGQWSRIREGGGRVELTRSQAVGTMIRSKLSFSKKEETAKMGVDKRNSQENTATSSRLSATLNSHLVLTLQRCSRSVTRTDDL